MLFALVIAAAVGASNSLPAGALPPPETVELRGRVICLPEEMHRLYKAELPTQHAHQWGFRTSNGSLYSLLPGKMSQPLLVDAQLREKELIIKGRLFPQSSVIEVLGNLRSVKGNERFELYYYCDICAIKSVSPDPCMCCQEEVKLVEVPLGSEAN